MSAELEKKKVIVAQKQKDCEALLVVIVSTLWHLHTSQLNRGLARRCFRRRIVVRLPTHSCRCR